MGRLRYIGSKARIASKILDIAGDPTLGRFFDVFSGTGVVSHEAAIRGWKVLANDNLYSSSLITKAQLLYIVDVPFQILGGYASALTELNSVEPVEGFIFREYSPSGQSASGHSRMYFTPDNGMRIDAIRNRIRIWSKKKIITRLEESLLLADLLEASNRVANIAGTYGCFLSHWTSTSRRSLFMMPRSLLDFKVKFRVMNTDSFKLTAARKDLVYIDPPYTKRQYAAYYHLLETIAYGDQPCVTGVTGLRPWGNKSSLFCYKRHALNALERLIFQLNARRILISYNSEGHITLNDICDRLGSIGIVKVHRMGVISRYNPNSRNSMKSGGVKEYIIELRIPQKAKSDFNVMQIPLFPNMKDMSFL